jgi:hypothetical protein
MSGFQSLASRLNDSSEIHFMISAYMSASYLTMLSGMRLYSMRWKDIRRINWKGFERSSFRLIEVLFQ